MRPSTATTLTLTSSAVAALLAVVLVGGQLTAVGWTGLALLGVALVVLALAPSNVGALRPTTPEAKPGEGILTGTTPPHTDAGTSAATL